MNWKMYFRIGKCIFELQNAFASQVTSESHLPQLSHCVASSLINGGEKRKGKSNKRITLTSEYEVVMSEDWCRW